MSTVTSLQNQTATLSALKGDQIEQNDEAASGKREFLEMLVTQLKNQDPMNPIDNQDFTAQLAQFSQLEQLIDMNQKMDVLTKKDDETGGMINGDYVGYLGRIAKGNAEHIYFGGDQEMKINYRLPENAKSVKILLVDEKGEIAKQVDAPPALAGNQSFTFKTDGLPVGTYKVLIGAKTFANTDVEGELYQEGKVTGVTSKEGQTFLNIGGALVPAEKVFELKD